MDFDNSGSPGRFFTSLVRELKSLAMTNIEYFKDGKHSHHARFHVAFCMLFEYLDLGIEPCFRQIYQRVHEFDASPTEKGNGYRSLLRIVQKCCLHLLQIARYISTNKESVLFRRAFYMKELEAYVATLGQLRACLYYAQKLLTYCQAGQLFADEETLDDAVADQLMTDVEMLSQDCFYGRCLGFQFCESMQRPLNVVTIAMASFAEGYQENSQIMKVATSLFNSGKYIMNPDLRAQQVVNVTRTADIQFCKAFWSITESDIMHQLPSMVCPSVQVDEVFHLGPDAFDMPSADGSEDITITPPCAHTGPAPVQVRLISHHLRDGQEQHRKSSKSPSSRSPPAKAARSPGLVVHCHGGGFVAQSSRSHEVYLRQWAKDLDVPILSIDYSLAPENPFPRALEECFYVYAWAVHNCEKLGSTGEVIVLAGDSAGANLMVTTAMRAAAFNIRRPDGILGVYTPVLVRYTPSPARLLSLMDPLLPAGILSRCLAAYAGVSDEVSSQLAASVSCHIESSAATLRLSSQETQESDWVVVSQDSAARTNTTLAASQASPITPPHTTQSIVTDSVDQVDKTQDVDAGENVLFSRPDTGGLLSKVVSGATGKLASYVGSYSHLLAKSFSSAPQTPEHAPLKPIHENIPDGEEGGALLQHSSSIDDSPHTPSFHTPMTTPSEEKAGRTEQPLDRSSSVDDLGMAETQPMGMVEVDLERPEAFPVLEGGCDMKPVMQGAVSDQTLLDDYSILQPSLHVAMSEGESCEEQLSSCQDPTAFSILDADTEDQSCVMPSLAVDKAELLLQELDHSATSNTPSTTLPSSLMSTPSDDLDSFDMLQPGPPTIDYTTEGRTDQTKDSDSSSSPSYKSPVLELQSACEKRYEAGEKKEGNEGQGTAGVQGERTEGESMDVTDCAMSSAVDISLSSQSPVHVDLMHNLCSSPTQLLPDNSACGKWMTDPLLSPDSGCPTDEADKSEPPVVSASVTSVTAGEKQSKPSPSRDNLHLNLRSLSSSSSLPRSASLPVLGEGVSSRMHSMSPSDFKRERHLAQSPLRAIRNIPIVKNPYMSPLLAPDWLLEGLPHICLVACHLDPLLDDSVMFTRRLRSLGKSVDLLLLDDLPHGFLNFSLASRDAKHASDLCMGKLKQLLNLERE